MLRQRIITALVLVAVLLGTLSLSVAWPFAVLTLVLIAAAGWEWGRLNQARPVAALAFGGVLAVLGGGALLWPLPGAAAPAVFAMAAAIWVLGGAVALRAGPAGWPQLPQWTRWGLGLVGLGAAWLAMTEARGLGINFLLSVLCLVWMADVAAYFGGRAFGRRKLAVSISPGKSWEGVWSGLAGVLLLGLLWLAIDRHFAVDSASLYTRLQQGWGWWGAAAMLLLLGGMSVVGDLVESLVKRAAGAKDSSQLLPGHGGVLDRVDALLPVLPLAVLAAWVVA
jgi:phosphatidate cytidylyltransferase